MRVIISAPCQSPFALLVTTKGVANKMMVRVSSYMRRTDRLLWTPYLTTCLNDLSRTGVPGDLTLISMVNTRKLLDKAFYSPPNSQTSASEVPADFVAAVLRTKLDKLSAEALGPTKDPRKTPHCLK